MYRVLIPRMHCVLDTGHVIRNVSEFDVLCNAVQMACSVMVNNIVLLLDFIL
jgi:uncharacterized protein YsxB (DUF464 family)